MGMYHVGPAFNPGFHVLAKDSGHQLLQSWAATNSGGLAGNAFIRLRNMSLDLPLGRIIAAGPILLVPAGGATVTLFDNVLSPPGLLATNFVTGANAMRLEMVSVDEGLVVGVHDFTINWGPGTPGGPVIAPVGDPAIA